MVRATGKIGSQAKKGGATMNVGDVTVSARRVDKAEQMGGRRYSPRDRVQDVNCLLLVLDLLALFFGLLSIEMGWRGTRWASTRTTESLKGLTTLVSVASAFVVLVRYHFQLKCQVEAPPSRFQLLCEFFIHLWHVPPLPMLSGSHRAWYFVVGAVEDPHQGHYPIDNLNALLIVRLYFGRVLR